MMFHRLIALTLLALISVSGASYSQDVPVLDEQPVETSADEIADPVVVEEAAPEENNGAIDLEEDTALDKRSMSLLEAYPQMKSLFFTQWEHDLIIEARKGLNVRPPEVPVEDLSSPASIQAGDMGVREISLGGIVYHSPQKWTLWLNGMQVTPRGLPEQVMNIKVFKDYIEIEWLDAATNQIYPIRLRPHQRFNLDSRIFLPG